MILGMLEGPDLISVLVIVMVMFGAKKLPELNALTLWSARHVLYAGRRPIWNWSSPRLSGLVRRGRGSDVQVCW